MPEFGQIPSTKTVRNISHIFVWNMFLAFFCLAFAQNEWNSFHQNCSKSFSHICIKFFHPNLCSMCPISVKIRPSIHCNWTCLICVPDSIVLFSIFFTSLFLLAMPDFSHMFLFLNNSIVMSLRFFADGAFVWTMKTSRNSAQWLFESLLRRIRRTAVVNALSAIFATHWVIYQSLG